jgi:DNA-binding FrmR family transcriptional regulator
MDVQRSGTAAVPRIADDQRKIVNRLKRANGQLVAVIGALENGADCPTTITQLSAVSGAIDRAGFALISSAMRDCVTRTASNDEREQTLRNLERLFITLA